MSRVKKACISSSAMPSRWSTQPSRVTLMLKVKIPMAASLLRVGPLLFPTFVCRGREQLRAGRRVEHPHLPGVLVRRVQVVGDVQNPAIGANFRAHVRFGREAD